MTEEFQGLDNSAEAEKPKLKSEKIRPLTTDERASFVILSLYMFIFCICTFLYWDALVLKILGVTSAAGGLFLFVAAFFNTEAPEKSDSIHPLRSYLMSLFITLLVLFVIRLVGGAINNVVVAGIVLYGGVLVALVVFRKAVVQMVTVLLAVVFVLVTISNRHDVMVGHMTFTDAVRQCGHVVFRIGPIQDVANLLIAGNYMGYLSRIDYRNEQINILTIRTVADAGDDELKKTEAILDFVGGSIYYVSDPDDGLEYAKDPLTTLIAGGGDCDDQSLLLCSMLESVGVKTYIAFTDAHVFVLVRFSRDYSDLMAVPYLFIDGEPCYALDPVDPEARIGHCSVAPQAVERVFSVRGKELMHFSLEESI